MTTNKPDKSTEHNLEESIALLRRMSAPGQRIVCQYIELMANYENVLKREAQNDN